MRVAVPAPATDDRPDPQTAAACFAAERLARQILLAAHEDAERLLAAARAEAAERTAELVGRAEAALEGFEPPSPPGRQLDQLAASADNRAAAILERAYEHAALVHEAADVEIAAIEARADRRRRALEPELRALAEERDAIVSALEARVASVRTAGRVALSQGTPRRRLRLVLLGASLVATAALAGIAGWAVSTWHAKPASPVITPLADPVARSSVCPIPGRYRPLFVDAARRTGLPLSLLGAVAVVESKWNANASSAKGALGLMQLLPATAREVDVNPYSPRGNVLGGARYLRQLLTRFHGNSQLALAAYDAGPSRVGQGTVPLETLLYVGSVQARVAATAGCR